MNYQQSLKFLNSFLNYERTPPKSYAELNLARMRFALAVLDHPEQTFVPILIAGTVGKGSTGYFLEQILMSSKARIGYYHSPHIQSIRERIRVNGKMLSENEWAKALSYIQAKLTKTKMPPKLGRLTYFEILTLLGIKIFSDKDVQAGIFEIGMGGRLDATNVLEAPVCILTKIDLDHQAFLGNTLAKIATEKAGIIKNASFVISAPQHPSVASVIRRAIAARGSVLSASSGTRANPSFGGGAKRRGLTSVVSPRLVIAKPVSFQPGLAGDFQKQNAGNAAAAADILRKYFMLPLTSGLIRKSLRSNQWSGRVETFSYRGRKIILDAAHNPAGCLALVNFLKQSKQKPAFFVFSALRDKDSREMLRVLSSVQAEIVLTPVPNPRSRNIQELKKDAQPFFDRIQASPEPFAAFDTVMQNTRKGDGVVVTGSFYLLGEFHKWIKS